MPDVSHNYGYDIDISPNGGLTLVDGNALSQQRVLKRLFTNPGAYIWHPNYGAGIGRFVGSVNQTDLIQATVQGQMLLEPTVLQNPPPTVTVQANDDGSFYCVIKYTTATSLPATLNFTVSSAGTYVQGDIYA